jgi:hypothetical protein
MVVMKVSIGIQITSRNQFNIQQSIESASNTNSILYYLTIAKNYIPKISNIIHYAVLI